jgi:hypothetical protein
LASLFALSSTFALADTSHHKHKSGAGTHQGTVGMSEQRAIGNYSRSGGCGANGCAGAAGGLVGGSDAGTYKP